MGHKEFIQYIGDFRIHDACIEDIAENHERVEVLIRSIDKELFKVVFYDVKEIKSNKVKAMVLYSISEISIEEPFRHFVFVNWDEEDDAYLEVIAKGYQVQDS